MKINIFVKNFTNYNYEAYILCIYWEIIDNNTKGYVYEEKLSYELSSQSWKLIGPIWLFATKFGNVSPNKTIVAFKRYFQILLLLYFRYKR